MELTDKALVETDEIANASRVRVISVLREQCASDHRRDLDVPALIVIQRVNDISDLQSLDLPALMDHTSE